MWSLLRSRFPLRTSRLPSDKPALGAQLGYMTDFSRWVVNIDQFPKSLARYIFRMEKRKETDQETIELLRQYFSGGNRSEPAILVVASPQRKQVGSSKAASDACSSRAEGDQFNLL